MLSFCGVFLQTDWLTDWMGLLFLFQASLCETALGSDYCQSPPNGSLWPASPRYSWSHRTQAKTCKATWNNLGTWTIHPASKTWRVSFIYHKKAQRLDRIWNCMNQRFLCDFGSLVWNIQNRNWTWSSLFRRSLCLGLYLCPSPPVLFILEVGKRWRKGIWGLCLAPVLLSLSFFSFLSAGCRRTTGNYNWRKQGEGSRCQRMEGGMVQEEMVR